MNRVFIHILYYGYSFFQFLVRPVTVGVRIVLIRSGQVLLIRHSYIKGWYLPGGGLKRGETLEAAARREALEEAGANLGQVSLMGIYSKLERVKSDHNAVFVCTDFQWEDKHDAEVAEVKFFPLTALPEDLRAGQRRRIEEYTRGQTGLSFGLW
jgi:ADP-ribose pyrophosphatase YjhB (NUDIX family)